MPHTADLRSEAWAPFERCLVEAARALVESFADLSAAAPTGTWEYTVRADDGETQLVAVLDEVIYRIDTAGELPLTMEIRRTGTGLQVTCVMAEVSQAIVVGAVPKAVSLYELDVTEGAEGCHCSVTLDVKAPSPERRPARLRGEPARPAMRQPA